MTNDFVEISLFKMNLYYFRYLFVFLFLSLQQTRLSSLCKNYAVTMWTCLWVEWCTVACRMNEADTKMTVSSYDAPITGEIFYSNICCSRHLMVATIQCVFDIYKIFTATWCLPPQLSRLELWITWEDK